MPSMKEWVTVSVEPEALEGARAEVESGRAPNLSVAVERSLISATQRRAMREYVEMWETDFGPISEEAREWARKELELPV